MIAARQPALAPPGYRRRISSRGNTCTVLPRPMSSAEHPPTKSLRRISQPKPFAAIFPQRSAEIFRGIGCVNMIKPPHFAAHAFRRFHRIVLRAWSPEAHPANRSASFQSACPRRCFAHAGERLRVAQPLLGQHAKRAVIQSDGLLAALHRRQQLGQGNELALELDAAVEFQPIRYRAANFDLGISRPAIDRSFASTIHPPPSTPSPRDGAANHAAPIACLDSSTPYRNPSAFSLLGKRSSNGAITPDQPAAARIRT